MDRLLLAYRSGIFPWSVNPITWWCPDPRAIFRLDQLHVSRSLDTVIRQGRFEVTIDKAFAEVIAGCAETDLKRQSTWISQEFIQAYVRLHRAGHAHSVECWFEGKLAGGIYGVAVAGLFAGESMFHRTPNASKVALYYLIQRLQGRGFSLFDIQMLTPFTQKMGAIHVSRDQYLEELKQALEIDCRF